MKKKLNRNQEKMKLDEMTFEPNYCDDGSDLELINTFFETNNKPTVNGRKYKGVAGSCPSRVSPYTFRLKEKVYDDDYGGSEWSNGFYDDNKLLGWPTDYKPLPVSDR